LNGEPWKVWLLAVFLIFCGGTFLLGVQAHQSAARPVLSKAAREKVLRYIRERFGVPDTMHLSLGGFRSSFASGFYEGSLTADDGKSKRDQVVWISKDSRYLIMGNLVNLDRNSNPQDSRPEMIRLIRVAFKVPDKVGLSLGSFRRSASADFQEGTLTVEEGKAKQERPLLLSRDGKHLILGEIYALGVDLRQQAMRIISLHNQPSQGPASAPVTIVEYADLECPSCAAVHQFYETQLLPRYGNKVRVVFKEFPLTGIHEWSLTGAIACQCAYEINPSAYVPLRSAIFRSQQLLSVGNPRDLLLTYGEQAGADRVKLAACIDAKSSLPRVEADVAEGKRVNVDRTPTAFINGQMIVGLPSPETYYQAVDEALRGAK
jgi:protein-disulfide isomerase